MNNLKGELSPVADLDQHCRGSQNNTSHFIIVTNTIKMNI